jgi:hypothetical protein
MRLKTSRPTQHACGANPSRFARLGRLFRHAIGARSPHRRLQPRRRASGAEVSVQPLEARCLLSFNPAGSAAVGGYPVAIVSADFNNDGRLDIATANDSDQTVSVLFGDGAGGFASARAIHTFYGAFTLTVGDFNNDGNEDLATLNGSTLDILLGNGDGTFQPPRTTSAPYALAMATGDLNGDGHLDLVVSGAGPGGDPYQGNVSVLLGDGQGGLALSTFQRTNSDWPTDVIVGDVDDDGWLDIVTASDYEGLSVMRGHGNGVLSPPQLIPHAGSITSLIAVDMTGEGTLDLVTAGDKVNVYTGSGDGHFTLTDSQVGNGGWFVSSAVGDFNGDGRIDVLAANDNGTVSVLLGNGDGTLRYTDVFAAAWWPSGMAVGDFNGDQRTDLAVADFDTSTVEVFLNDGVWTSFQPAVRVSDARVVEGNSGTRTATFTVSLSAPSSEEVRVSYQTEENSSALAGSD